jgi:16S rRNA (guanine966-N2)-methyltransferase
MRVIAGDAKGRKLKAATGRGLRPMTDQIREALFSSLGDRVVGAAVLDLYAGSGSIGIEALSRGAASALFVERDRHSGEVIRENLQTLGLSDRGTVVIDDVERFVARRPNSTFGLVVVDPPFASGLPSSVLNLLAEQDFLDPDSLLILRLSSRTDERPGGDWQIERERRYGDSILLSLKRRGS